MYYILNIIYYISNIIYIYYTLYIIFPYLFIYLYIYMDGWMDVWMYACMDVWMHGRMYIPSVLSDISKDIWRFVVLCAASFTSPRNLQKTSSVAPRIVNPFRCPPHTHTHAHTHTHRDTDMYIYIYSAAAKSRETPGFCTKNRSLWNPMGQKWDAAPKSGESTMGWGQLQVSWWQRPYRMNSLVCAAEIQESWWNPTRHLSPLADASLPPKGRANPRSPREKVQVASSSLEYLSKREKVNLWGENLRI